MELMGQGAARNVEHDAQLRRMTEQLKNIDPNDEDMVMAAKM